MYPNYIDQAHLVSNCDPEPWDLVQKLSFMVSSLIYSLDRPPPPLLRFVLLTICCYIQDLGINCIRELSQAAARLQRTGEEDGIYVEIDPDEWVELDTAGNDVEREDEADPDEEEYVLL